MSTRVIATIVLMVAMFMDLMDSTITNVALPAIGADLGANPAQLEWTLAGYVIAFATLLITGGRLGDVVGRRRIFVIGVAGFTLASLFASLAQSGDFLVAARIVQGAFAGIMVPQVLSSIQVMFTPEERGPILGITGALSALGAVAGLLFGGWIVTVNAFGLGWRSIFLVNIPIGIVLILAALLVVPRSRSEHPLKLDLVGVLLGAVSVFLVVFPLTDGRQAGWAAWIWAMLIAAPFAIAAFIAHQKRRLARDSSALLPMPLFRNRGFSSGLLVQVLSSVGNGGYALILLFYVQQALGFTALSAGLTILPIALGSMIATGIAVPLSQRFGKSLVLVGGVIQAGAFTWVVAAIAARGSELNGWDLALPLTLAGVGMMLLIMPLMGLTLATIPATEAGAASGTLTTFGQLGMVLGVALAGAVYFGMLGENATRSSAQGAVTTGLWVPVAAYLLAGLAALALPRMTPSRVDAPRDAAAVLLDSV
ncbi:DHA2 family efflux MFS transporter permease subunit [Leifsonia sp. Root112D2]|uniref:DHA2 family efflux MFS transporter permease subunit n=1 Tax=Leifsonia sp. Root112D2 TaxID=1736426 RepID=UPI0006FAB8E6|nr:DHA2 family efflux MFS transporter permease subunit [Leifsonia sp. Root112D2]KQV07029.1 MFS transporter [Leifsonia sp. Root112D2]